MNIAPDNNDEDADDWYDDEDRNRYHSTGIKLCEEAKWHEDDEDNREMEWMKGH